MILSLFSSFIIAFKIKDVTKLRNVVFNLTLKLL